MDVLLRWWFPMENEASKGGGDNIKLEILLPLIPLVVNYPQGEEPQTSTRGWFILSPNVIGMRRGMVTRATTIPPPTQ
jgi:hypothetical protein